jgi:hypothetical protein
VRRQSSKREEQRKEKQAKERERLGVKGKQARVAPKNQNVEKHLG